MDMDSMDSENGVFRLLFRIFIAFQTVGPPSRHCCLQWLRMVVQAQSTHVREPGASCLVAGSVGSTKVATPMVGAIMMPYWIAMAVSLSSMGVLALCRSTGGAWLSCDWPSCASCFDYIGSIAYVDGLDRQCFSLTPCTVREEFGLHQVFLFQDWYVVQPDSKVSSQCGSPQVRSWQRRECWPG